MFETIVSALLISAFQIGSNVACIEDFAAALSLQKVYSLVLRKEQLRARNLPDGLEFSIMVWRAATNGAIVTGGSFKLHSSGLLLLVGDGVHFHGTTFSGATHSPIILEAIGWARDSSLQWSRMPPCVLHIVYMCRQLCPVNKLLIHVLTREMWKGFPDAYYLEISPVDKRQGLLVWSFHVSTPLLCRHCSLWTEKSLLDF